MNLPHSPTLFISSPNKPKKKKKETPTHKSPQGIANSHFSLHVSIYICIYITHFYHYVLHYCVFFYMFMGNKSQICAVFFLL
ncbi:hypothetical protein L1987_59026 [Smallanthus sonchifolius]|uniref:Uncharacterized protein n=1 Tax=Smallanthus sonchifolius TaxID=185202 RepID=A0ACB9D426_9ASTR|nr:hypothetical protein L1987_59026 [Smallanthus sonchifolius]